MGLFGIKGQLKPCGIISNVFVSVLVSLQFCTNISKCLIAKFLKSLMDYMTCTFQLSLHSSSLRTYLVSHQA